MNLTRQNPSPPKVSVRSNVASICGNGSQRRRRSDHRAPWSWAWVRRRPTARSARARSRRRIGADIAHHPANLSEREVATPWGLRRRNTHDRQRAFPFSPQPPAETVPARPRPRDAGTVRAHETSRAGPEQKCDAICFCRRPVDHPVCFCRRCNGATIAGRTSARAPTPHRSL